MYQQLTGGRGSMKLTYHTEKHMLLSEGVECQVR